MQDAPHGGLQALPDGAASTTTPTPRSVRTGCTGVRGTERGHYPRHEGEDPGQTGETPYERARPRPEGHDVHLSEEASPGLTQGLTRLTPRPRTCGRAAGLRTCVGVVDVSPGRVSNPKTRPQPPGTSTTRRVPRAGVARGAGGRHPTGSTGEIGRCGRGSRPLTSSRRFRRHRNENPVSDQQGMSGNELGTNRLEHRGNPAIPTKTRPQTNTRRPIIPGLKTRRALAGHPGPGCAKPLEPCEFQGQSPWLRPASIR